MSLETIHSDCADVLSRTSLRNVTDGAGVRWLQVPGHVPHLIAAHKNGRDRFEIRLKPRPNKEFYEETTTLLFSHLITRLRPRVVFDVGCAGGYFSVLAASHIDVHPEVHAFDMQPGGIESLMGWSSHLSLPGVIHAHLAGLSDHHVGTTRTWSVRSKLFEKEPTPDEYMEPWWLRAKFALQGNTHRRNAVHVHDVLLTSLDRFCADRALAPGLIKLDVDGYEGKVLRGATALLRDVQPMIVLELHRDKLQRDGLTRTRIAELMHAAGYRALFLTDHHDRARCRLVPVEPGHALFDRQETDMLLYVPPRLSA